MGSISLEKSSPSSSGNKTVNIPFCYNQNIKNYDSVNFRKFRNFPVQATCPFLIPESSEIS